LSLEQLEKTSPAKVLTGPGESRRRVASAFDGSRGLMLSVARDKFALIGILFMLVIIISAVFAPWVAPMDPNDGDIARRLKPPAWESGDWSNLLGTDQQGRDLLSRIFWGGRSSLVIALSVVVLAGSFGTLIGLLAGYFGGKVDTLLMRLTDVQTAFPGLLLALLILTMVGPSVTALIIVLSINGWMVYARMMRGQVLSLREMPFIEAAQAIGANHRRVMFRHLLPNLASPLLTLGTLEFARIILAESILSFLGVGVQPPDMSWGLIIADAADYFQTNWWFSTFPGLAIALTVLSVNVVASWLRTQADPLQRSRRSANNAQGH
jgi:ABC-type dipeptide/oligopeptide/nickel transport system permease subunit